MDRTLINKNILIPIIIFVFRLSFLFLLLVDMDLLAFNFFKRSGPKTRGNMTTIRAYIIRTKLKSNVKRSDELFIYNKIVSV